MDESRGGSRIVYPKLLAALTEAALVSQFRLAPEERAWAGTVARRGLSMVVVLTRLKVFQSIGHFLPLAQIPATALSYIAKQLSLAALTDVSTDPRTTYRQNSAIRTYLSVTPWGASARGIASNAVAVAAETRVGGELRIKGRREFRRVHCNGFPRLSVGSGSGAPTLGSGG
jgi:hypothetical protein